MQEMDRPEFTLYEAVLCGDVEKARDLVKHAKYDDTDWFGSIPLLYACWGGHLDVVRMLISEFKADPQAQLHWAVTEGNSDVVLMLITEFGCDANARNSRDETVLHVACIEGNLTLARTLIINHNAAINARNENNDTPLHLAAKKGNNDIALMLITEFGCNTGARNFKGETVLHMACEGGSLTLVRTLIVNHNADINAQNEDKDTPLHLAVKESYNDIAFMLITEFGCNTNARNTNAVLHIACEDGRLALVRTLIVNHNADVNAQNEDKDTPLHLAVKEGYNDIAFMLITEFGCNTNARNTNGETVLHMACEGGSLTLVRTLIVNHNADINAQNANKNTPLHLAVKRGYGDVALMLCTEFGCDPNVKGHIKRTPLHVACQEGSLTFAKHLIQECNADIYAQDIYKDTPLHLAANKGKEGEILEIISEAGCDTNIRGKFGRTLLHIACERGFLTLATRLIQIFGADVCAQDEFKDTPLHLAANRGKKDFILKLTAEYGFNANIKGNLGRTMLHIACKRGFTALAKSLIRNCSSDIYAKDNNNDTPLHLAVHGGGLLLVLVAEFKVDINVKGRFKRTLLHSACQQGYLDLAKSLIRSLNAKINAQDEHSDTPLHLAAGEGKSSIALALIKDFGCDTNIRNRKGDNFLHSACRRNQASIVKSIGRYASLLSNYDGDTPLHLAAASAYAKCVGELLQLNPPIMLRNAAGKTARDVADGDAKQLIDAYATQNQDKIYVHYDKIIRQAKRKYSKVERITRIFVIGHPEAGKSSFIEAMKRERFFESFSKVSKSSVPLHTAGIVPSIHTSKHYGRVLFYDFAGDPEYYSSHAAILENLASSDKGDNIFIIVVDLRKDVLTIRNILYYWLYFVHYQRGKKNFITIGSHSDLLTSEEAHKKIEKISAFQFEEIEIKYFTLNCCKPRSKQLEDIRSRIFYLTKNSPLYELSPDAIALLGLLEKDFGNVTACSAQKILSHIEATGISLPKNSALLMPILEELHDLGLLFVVEDNQCDSPQIILNISKLTNDVHRLLFSKEASESEEAISSFNIGIIPKSTLDKLLPQHITKECLVQLQYCQEISPLDVNAFQTVGQPDSSSESFLFFPALYTVGRSDVPWVTPLGLSCSIGWLARCANISGDYFPPRFLHVLLLRLVFGFTLAVPAQHQTDNNASPDHSLLKRRCSMWNCGVHWSMEEGVECMVELVDGNKGVVVVTNSKPCNKENCVRIFHRIISCVMEAKAEFCHSIKLQFFLLDPSQSADYLHEDNLFAMSDVERVLVSCDKKEVISVTGEAKMEREKLACLCKFTLWNSLFSLNFSCVHHYLEDVVKELCVLFIHLGLDKSLLDTIETNFPDSVDRRRVELVDKWISTSSPDPPCWWDLVQALKKIKYGRLAQDLETQYSKYNIMWGSSQ